MSYHKIISFICFMSVAVQVSASSDGKASRDLVVCGRTDFSRNQTSDFDKMFAFLELRAWKESREAGITSLTTMSTTLTAALSSKAYKCDNLDEAAFWCTISCLMAGVGVFGVYKVNQGYQRRLKELKEFFESEQDNPVK